MPPFSAARRTVSSPPRRLGWGTGALVLTLSPSLLAAPAPGPDAGPAEASADSVAPEASSPAPESGAAAAAPKHPDETHPGETSARQITVETGTRARESVDRAPLPVTVITRDQLEERAATTVDVALESETSVAVQRDFSGAGLRLGGLDPKYSAVMLDGRRLTGRVGGTLDLRGLRLEDIAQIEILRGPGTVAYGADALAGVVNLVSRRPADLAPGFHGEASLRAGSRASVDLGSFASWRRGRWGLAAFGNYDRADAWRRDEASPGTAGDASSGWALGGSAERRSERSRVRARFDYDRRAFTGVDTPAGGAILDRRKLRERMRGRLFASHEFHDLRISGDLALTTFRDQYAIDQRGSDQLDEYQDTRNPGVQAGVQLDETLGEHVVSEGIDVQYESLSGPRLEPSSNDRVRVGIFAQDQWDVGELLTLFPGARIDIDSRFGTYLTPRAAAALRPGRWNLRTSFGRGYRAPSMREMFLAFDNPGAGYQVRGNAALRPETSWSTTLDAEWRPRTWFSVGSFVFNHAIEDAIITDLVAEPSAGQAARYAYANAAQVRTRGVEGRLELLASDWAVLQASLQYTQARDILEDRPLPGQAPWQAAIDLRFKVGPERWKTHFGGRASWFDARPLGGDAGPAPAYWQLDARIAQTLTSRCQLFVSARNLLDAGDDSLNPIPPRSFYGGISGRL